jgi:hypothetical protein
MDCHRRTVECHAEAAEAAFGSTMGLLLPKLERLPVA